MTPGTDLVASCRVEERGSLGAAWEVAARTTLPASVGRMKADYRNPIVPLSGPARTDTGDVAEPRVL